MPSKKLMSLLRDFSNVERTRFDKYLKSPYFNESEELESLYHFLTEHLQCTEKPCSTNKTLNKIVVWQHIFFDKKYDDVHLRRLFSELTKHALHFLTLERSEEKLIKDHLAILEILQDTNLNAHFTGILKRTLSLQANFSTNANFHLHQHQVEAIQHRRNEKLGYQIQDFLHFSKADYHLDCYYIRKKLKYYCDFLNYKDLFTVDINIDLFPNFLSYLAESVFLREPAIQGYFLVVQMLLYPEQEVFFFDLQQHLHRYQPSISEIERKEFYIHLLNYCLYKKINTGRVDFFKETFLLLRSMLNENLVLENDKLPISYYKLITSVGIQVREFAWTEAFIQNYTPKLPPEERENALTYNLAKVYFAQNQYEKVIEQLREVEYDNLTYALGGKLMLLKTYYELNEYLALDSLIDSFRVYLRRNQTISKEVRQQYLNVLRFIKKLSNIHSGDQVAIAKIEQQIQECKNLADKGWIVQKVESLKG